MLDMADAKGVMSRTGSKGFRALKTLTDGVVTKFNMVALAVAAVFLVLGNTEPAKTEEPTTITPGETVELTQAHVVFDKPRIEDGQVHVTATVLNTQDAAFSDFQRTFTLTKNGEPLPFDQFSISPSLHNGPVTNANPGVPFALDIIVDDVPGTVLTINDLTVRKSSLDMSYRWFDPTPVAEMELA